MARSQPRRQPEKPGGAMRHQGHLAVLAIFLLLAACFAACEGSDSPRATPKLGDVGTSEVQFASVSAGVFHT